NSTVYIGVPNKFFGEWLETHYGALFAEAVAIASGGEPLTVEFVVREKTAASPTELPAVVQGGKGQSLPKPRRGILLNPKYTFRNFVVGAGNQFAHAACMAVAEQPGQTYNPLFIYGGVGLGKTHLLNAIGNHVAEQRDLRIAYLTTEQFTNEVINSIRYDKMMDLRKRYRHI
ncbi:MAG TPA: chromosomal replication initiator protein DnaA, partial [Nitrospira sp.]|nr:chromosomal replication initiator protein DnaA [Nitrospira sp.]